MKTELVFSSHVFRASIDEPGELPRNAPKGQNFYLVTNPLQPRGTKKKYFMSAPSGGKSGAPRLVSTFDRGLAMKFTSLTLAETYATFINNMEIFPTGEEFWIVLEAEGYVGASFAGRRNVTSLAEVSFK